MSEHFHHVEGIGRVVRLDGDLAWLEPEQTTSCGHCASASTCGAKGIGSVASRLEARRFAIDNVERLRMGERVVVVIDDRALLKGTLTAYGIPLVAAFAAGGLAQWLLGSDLATLAAMIAGLGAGLLLSRLTAGRLNDSGELVPRFLRRARPDESCHTT